MSPLALAIERAVTDRLQGMLRRRAGLLRDDASRLITTQLDGRGRRVTISSPEAVVMVGTAAFLEGCAADLGGAT